MSGKSGRRAGDGGDPHAKNRFLYNHIRTSERIEQIDRKKRKELAEGGGGAMAALPARRPPPGSFYISSAHPLYPLTFFTS